MLYINYKLFVSPNVWSTLEWQIGNTSPSNQIDEEGVEIISIYADGKELEFIKDNFVNIPCRIGASTATWRGEFARFIYDNL